MSQTYTSANTSINKTKLPVIYNKIDWDNLYKQYCARGWVYASEPAILDVGAGKYTAHIRAFCKNKGFKYYAYDKYNGSTEGWDKIIPALVVCSNTFNVIDDYHDVKELHEWIRARNRPYVITVYEGNKSGSGKITKKDCYQRNEKLSCYKLADELIYKNVLTKDQYKCYIK